jgi:hypothetical protein
MSFNFDVSLSARFRKEEVAMVVRLVNDYPAVYSSVSHFVRVAVIKEIKRLEDDKDE